MAQYNITITSGQRGPVGAGVQAGGTTNQFLQKASNADYDTRWVDSATVVNTIGEILDVTITNAQTGDILSWNGSQWVNTSTPTVDSLQFSGGTGTQGTVSWNADEETLDLIQNGAVLQLGQEVQFHVRNATINPILNGTVVMATGTIGTSGRITVAPMDGTNPNNSHLILGIATEDIPAGEDGKVTEIGKVRGLNTSGYTEGAILYVSTTVPGGLQTAVPTGNDLKMPIAFVVNQHATNGTLAVRVTPINENFIVPGDNVSRLTNDAGYLTDVSTQSIKDLSDVRSVMTPLDGQVLTFDSANGWQAETPVSGVVDHGLLNGLSDDDHPQYLNNARGDVRYYTKTQIDTAGYLTNASSIKLLSDVSDSMTPTDGQVLTFDTINGWQAETPVTPVVDHGALTGLADDDHTQYLLATGARNVQAASGNTTLTVRGASAPGIAKIELLDSFATLGASLSSGPDGQFGTLTLNDSGATLGALINGNGALRINPTGAVSIKGLTYPSVDGGNGQVLTTNGSGQLSFAPLPGTVSTLNDLGDVSLTGQAKGSILASNGFSVFQNVNVGTDGQVLTADSVATNGVSWSTPTVAWGSVTGTLSSQTDLQSALDGKIASSEKGAANGVATLDAGSKIPSSQLPALALTDVNTVANEAAMVALVAQEGDLAIRTDVNKTFVHNGGVAGTAADWSELLTPTDQVLSVDGRTGAVTLSDLYAGVSHTHDASAVISGTFNNARISQTNVTQHQSALILTKSQISDFGTYIPTSEKGAANGVATLDALNHVPTAQLGDGTADNTKFLRGDNVWAVPGGGQAGIGSLTFYKSDGSQDDIDLTAATSLTTLSLSSEFNMDAAADFRVNNTFGWRDLFGTIEPRGQQAPTFTQFRDGIYLYAVPSNQTKEWFIAFHIDHDYAIGTKLYPHIHFSVNTTSSGTVRFGIEYTVAKGHAQVTGSTYGPTTTVYVEQAVNGGTDQYKHFVTEVSDLDAIPATNVEPDTVILMRMFTDTAHPNFTYADNIFLIQADLHYQIGKFATPNKVPNFYA